MNAYTYKPYYIYLIAGIVLCLFAFFSSVKMPFSSQNEFQSLQEADAQYRIGETATSVVEQELAFNKALTLYLDAEPVIKTTKGKGLLHYNIANSYFQLQQYPMAVLHYYKSLSFNSNTHQTILNLNSALDILGLSKASDTPSYFYNKQHLTLSIQLFLMLTILLFLSGSLYIWIKKEWMKLPLIIMLSSWILFEGYNVYMHLSEPVEGIIVQASMFYHKPQQSIAKTDEEPLLSGRKVKILEYQQESAWVQITLPDGRVGFVLKTSIRII